MPRRPRWPRWPDPPVPVPEAMFPRCRGPGARERAWAALSAGWVSCVLQVQLESSSDWHACSQRSIARYRRRAIASSAIWISRSALARSGGLRVETLRRHLPLTRSPRRRTVAHLAAVTAPSSPLPYTRPEVFRVASLATTQERSLRSSRERCVASTTSEQAGRKRATAALGGVSAELVGDVRLP
jgi:hypothetical protein